MNKIDKKNVKYVLYARKSTEASDKQVQSIDDQIRLMKARAERDGLQIVDVLSEAKSGQNDRYDWERWSQWHSSLEAWPY